jgi:hypothetical protein
MAAVPGQEESSEAARHYLGFRLSSAGNCAEVLGLVTVSVVPITHLDSGCVIGNSSDVSISSPIAPRTEAESHGVCWTRRVERFASMASTMSLS